MLQGALVNGLIGLLIYGTISCAGPVSVPETKQALTRNAVRSVSKQVRLSASALFTGDHT